MPIRTGWRSPLLRSSAVVLFLTAIALVAEITGQREIIFPEAGALCVGLWLMPKAVWNVRIRQVPLLLTAAALVGIAINLFVPACFEIRFALAFCIVALMLRLVRCNMYPVVSASMLPVLINTTSWVYPVSVLVISSLLAVGRVWLPQTDRTEYHPFGWLHWLKLVAALFLFLAIEVVATHTLNFKLSTLNYMMVPPLVVTMIEFANRRSGFRERPLSILGLIIAAAALGTVAELFLHRTFGIPMAIGTLLTVVAMLLLFRRFKPFAPALAIVLVPMLLLDGVLPWFPIIAAIGAVYFIVAGMLFTSK